MDERMRMGAQFDINVERTPGIVERFFVPQSKWCVECYDKDGNLKWVDGFSNIVTDEGCTDVLKRYFATSAQINSWYMWMFENNVSPAAGATYASSGLTECSAYDEATRPVFTPGAPAAKSTSNSAAKGSFTINATKTLYGAALVGGGSAPATKNDTASGGVLYCAGTFGSPRSVVATDVVRVTVTLGTQDV